jgi:adenosylcobinamide kinase/adenosylcobinamide-phosphate guanylyltransferase
MAELVLTLARSELILGGQKSGKSRLIATAQPWDDEMQARIARHQLDRAERVPGLRTVEEPLALAQKINQCSRLDTLILVDCLTLWLTNWLMPATPSDAVQVAPIAGLLEAIAAAPAFVDALGTLNQDVARVCQRVTLMAAGLPLTLKAVA